MYRKYWIILLLLNLFIAIGFFLENRGVGYSQLSSDLHNSIPVCFKLDDPELYQHDLFLYDIEKVRYYTPFYIETVRFFAKLSNGDYLLGINLMATMLHLIYGLGWFLVFFRLFRNFALALLLSVLIRGILWLPGFEIWGISDLWTMMPRTMYAALLPLPFLLLFERKATLLFAASFLIGFIFNLHPITGIGGVILFFLTIAGYDFYFKIRITTKHYIDAVVCCLFGMIPYLLTYVSQTDSSASYDLAEYQAAFSARIPAFFTEPAEFLSLWLRGSTLLFLLPMLIFLIYGIIIDSKHLRTAKLLISLSLMLIILSSISVYIERFVNDQMNLNLRMAFQIIRAQKLAVLPGYVAIGFLISIALRRSEFLSRLFPAGVTLFIIALAFSKQPMFGRLPFFKDDIAKSIFPDRHIIFAEPSSKLTDLDKMMVYIEANTKPEDVFWGNYLVRCGARRSSVLDTKGASLLIEGNPLKLIQWHKENAHLESLEEGEKIEFLRNRKAVTHILSSGEIGHNASLIHTQGKFRLYKITP